MKRTLDLFNQAGDALKRQSRPQAHISGSYHKLALRLDCLAGVQSEAERFVDHFFERTASAPRLLLQAGAHVVVES